MVGRLYGGVERMRDKYYDFTPSNLEMAIIAQNTSDQFTDPALMPLNSQDAMERYQLQLMKTSTPETRIPRDVDKTLSNRKRARELINLIDRGGPRGSNDLAYKPEIVQSNKSTYTYAVPSTDPIVSSYENNRDGSGTYHASSSGGTVYRMTLPNQQTNAELGNKIFNFQNNRAKYAAAINKVENTSQIVDFIPEHKDPLWISRALDVTRHRLMPKLEIYTDNGDNVNREKNRCRDTEKVSYKYRHKEYDVNKELHEVLDGGNRIKPEIGPRESDGTPIGNLVAQLAKKGIGYSYEEADIVNIAGKIDGRKNTNPNINRHSKKQAFDNQVHNYHDDKDGKINNYRPKTKVKTVVDNAVEGLDIVMKEILMGEVIDEIKRSSKKVKVSKPKTAKSVNKNFDISGHNVDDDEKNEAFKRAKQEKNHYDDAERDVMNFQIPILTSNFKKEIAFVQSNRGLAKANTSGQKRGYNVNDTEIVASDDSVNGIVNRTQAENLIEKSGEVGQGVRGLITELVPEIETLRSNDPINPNRRIVHGKGGKIVKFAVNNSELFDRPDDDMDTVGRGTRKQEVKPTYKKRPILPKGIKLDEQIEFRGVVKKPNKKRGKVSNIRDDGLF